MTFPKSFFMGDSISAAQAESGWNEDGRGPVQIDFGVAGKADEGGRRRS